MKQNKQEFMDKYRDPRWQRKRLEILERDGFECSQCGTNNKPLHIHHQYYEQNKDPWDYPDESLYCYCEDCHKKHEELKKKITLLFKHIEPSDYERLIGYLTIMNCNSEYYNERETTIHATDNEFIIGMCDYLGLDERKIERIVGENDYIIEYSKLKNWAIKGNINE